jgi:hypothetical protein
MDGLAVELEFPKVNITGSLGGSAYVTLDQGVLAIGIYPLGFVIWPWRGLE